MEDTPGQKGIVNFKDYVLKDDFKLTPALKQELEKIAMKLKKLNNSNLFCQKQCLTDHQW